MIDWLHKVTVSWLTQDPFHLPDTLLVETWNRLTIIILNPTDEDLHLHDMVASNTIAS